MKTKLLKKLCSCLLALFLLTSTGIGQAVGEYFGTNLTVSAAEEKKIFLFGDVNNDNVIDEDDILIINKYRLGEGELTPEQMILADVNDDGIVDLDDILSLNKYRLGKVETMPIQNNLIDYGYCGDNAKYILDNDGILTIFGSGEMMSFSQNGSPWYDNRNSIKNVNIVQGITIIGGWSFCDCVNLKNVSIPDDVTKMYPCVFQNCTSLTNITLPADLKSFGGGGTFMGCTSLTSINISADNSAYCSENGILFNKSKTCIIAYPGGKQGSYAILDSVTSVGSWAFGYCSGLTDITIPDSVTSVGGYAFFYCNNLISLTIPNSVTSIGDYAFQYCMGLTSLTISNSLTVIPRSTFADCRSLTSVTIPNSVTTIGEYAFSHCSNLTNITIPNSVTEIGALAFWYCTRLPSITIPDSVTTIGKYAFEDCKNLTSITIPNSVTEIGNDISKNCPNVTIYGSKGSYAETYAKNNNISFVETVIDYGYAVNVKFDSKGGNSLNSVDLTNAEKYGTLPTPVKRGYIFKGWSLNETTENKSLFEKDTDIYFQMPECWRYDDRGVPYDNIIIYCHLWNTETDNLEQEQCIYPWKDNSEICTYMGNNIYQYTIPAGSDVNGVIFASNQFDQTNDISLGTVCANDILTVPDTDPNNPILQYRSVDDYGYALGYWYVAEWAVNKEFKSLLSKVAFQPDMYETPVYNAYWAKRQDRIVASPKDVKINGYKFVDENMEIPLPISHNLYAVWEKAGLYSLSYHMTGGSGSIENQQVYSNEKVIVTSYQPAKTGYVFRGWTTNQNSTTIRYKAGDEISLSSDTVLYAVWSKLVSSLTVTLTPSEFTYDGTKKIPAVTVKDGEKTLVLNTDYSFEYENNINAGTGKVIVTGKGNYTGTLEKTFIINPKSISNAELTINPTSFTYDGNDKRPAVTLKDGEKELSDEDYSIVYTSNKNAGTGKVTVTGKGNYTGTLEKTFIINPKSISNAELIIHRTEFIYDGKRKTPDITVKDDGKELSYNDYRVSYSENQNAGTAIVAVTGYGNYTDTLEKTFTIYPKSIINAELTIEPTVFTYDGTEKKPNVIVKDGTKTLVLNTDYSLKYENNINIGTAKVTVTGRNNYTGTAQTTFSITEPFFKFEWNADNWQFENSSRYIENVPYSEKINSTYLDVLKENLSYSEYIKIFGGEGSETAWINTTGGSCYGMSATAFLAKYGFMDFSDYQTNADKLYDLDAPIKHDLNYLSDKNNVSSLITYYQLLQVKDVIRQKYRKVSNQNNKTNMQELLALLNENAVVLVGYQWGTEKNPLAHAVLAYGYGYENNTFNGVSYDGYIKIYDPNCSYNDTGVYIYFNQSTYDWIIPGKQLSSSGYPSVKFSYISADSDEINNGGYFDSNTNSNDSDRFIARIDAPVISKERFVSKVAQFGGVYMNQTGGENDIIEDYSYILNGTANGIFGYNLYDPDSAYEVSQKNPAQLELHMDYENCDLYGYSSLGKSVVFDKKGFVSIEGETGDYEMSMTFDRDYPTDWFYINVSGTDASDVSLLKKTDGYILSGDHLRKIQVYAQNMENSASIEFSTDYKKVFIYETDKHTIGLKADKDNDGTYETDITNIPVLENNSYLSSTNIKYGSSVTVTASGRGGAGSLQYAVLCKKQSETKWTVKQDYSANTTVSVTSDKATDYDICVKVKDADGNIQKKYFTLNVYEALANKSSISDTSVSIGNTVTVHASATGGMGNYTYAALYKKKTDTKWTVKQNFGKNANIEIKPDKATDYDICVKVKDGNGNIEKKYFVVKVCDVLNNTSTVSAAQITLGSMVSVKASATGGAGNYTYAVYYKKKSDTKWTAKQNFGKNANIEIKPDKATDYDICVKVKDGNGNIEKKYFVVKVYDVLNNTSVISSAQITLGSMVSVKASATGGAGNYTYAVYYKKKSDSNWTVKQDFDKNTAVSIKPVKATAYDICVKVKDSIGNVDKKYFSVTVK